MPSAPTTSWHMGTEQIFVEGTSEYLHPGSPVWTLVTYLTVCWSSCHPQFTSNVFEICNMFKTAHQCLQYLPSCLLISTSVFILSVVQAPKLRVTLSRSSANHIPSNYQESSIAPFNLWTVIFNYCSFPPPL